MQISYGESKAFEDVSKYSQDVSMSADASYMFVHASASAEHGSETSRQSKTSKAKKITRMQYLGAQPDPETGIIPRSTSPALIEKKLEPICYLIKGSILKKECHKFLRSKAFCFTGLPPQPSSQVEGHDEMLESLFKMKTYGRCGDVGLPLIGWKANPNWGFDSPSLSRIDKDTYFEYLSKHEGDQVSCLAACAQRKNCVLASVFNGGCTHCLGVPLPKQTWNLLALSSKAWDGYFGHSGVCSKRYGDARLGIRTKIVDSPNHTDKFDCVISVPADYDRSHCYESLEPAESFNSAFTHVFQTNKMPPFPERDVKFSGSIGVPLYEEDKIVGEALGSQEFVQEVPYVPAKRLFEYVASFWRNVGYGADYNPGIVNNITLAVAKTCDRYCSNITGCDSFSVRIIPPVYDFFDFFLVQRKSGNDMELKDGAVEKVIDSGTSDSFRKIFQQFNATHLWKKEVYQPVIDPVWDTDQFLDPNWEYFEEYGATKYTKHVLRDKIIQALKGRDVKELKVHEKNLAKSFLSNVWKGLGLVGDVSLAPVTWTDIPWNHLEKQVSKKVVEERTAKSESQGYEKLEKDLDDLIKAYDSDAFQIPMRPWFQKFAPLKLPVTCGFHKMRDVVLVGGSHEDCFEGSPNKDCKMQVGQFFSSDSFQVYGHDVFRDKWL